MGKAAKSARALKRKKEKAGRKSANSARYAAMRDAGTNSKSKRNKLKAKRATSIRIKRNKKSAISYARLVELEVIAERIAKANEQKQKKAVVLKQIRKQKKAKKVAKNVAIWAACGHPIA